MSSIPSSEAAAEAFYAGHWGLGLGSQFMAVCFDSLLFGVLLCQCTHWVPNWKHDPMHTKIIVAFGTLAAFGTTFFTWGDYMTTFVTDFGQFERFASFKQFGYYPFLDALTVIPVQMVFAERSIKINKRNWLVIFIDALLIVGTIVAAMGVVISTRGHDMYSTNMAIRTCLVAWPSICTSAHLWLTGSIIYGLLQAREEQSIRANKIIYRIMYICLESQLPATAFAFTAMIVIAINPKSMFIPWVIIVHPKVFMVGCLAMINARHAMQREGKLPSSNLDSTHLTGPTSSSTSSRSRPRTPKMLFRDASIIRPAGDTDDFIEMDGYSEDGRKSRAESLIDPDTKSFV